LIEIKNRRIEYPSHKTHGLQMPRRFAASTFRARLISLNTGGLSAHSLHHRAIGQPPLPGCPHSFFRLVLGTQSMNFTIDDMAKHDWKQVRKIYREGLATGLAAFMSDPPIWKVWDAAHLTVGRLVARTDDAAIVGWSALAQAPDT